MTKVLPINGHVLVKPLDAPAQTAGGLHLPDSARAPQRQGEVLAVADDATEEVAVGDRVVYGEMSGTEVEFDGERYLLLPSDDVLVKYVSVDEIPE